VAPAKLTEEHEFFMSSLIDEFCANGFIAVRGAFSAETARACLASIHDELRAHGVDPDDRDTWTKPVVRFNCPAGPPFEAAATSPALWSIAGVGVPAQPPNSAGQSSSSAATSSR
jgi:hypothetical protein